MKGGFKLSPLRILYLTRVYPYPPASGGDVAYSRGVIESLRAAAQLTVLAATTGRQPAGTGEEDGIDWILVPQPRRRAAPSLFAEPAGGAWHLGSAACRKALPAALAASVDAVVIDGIAPAPVLRAVAGWHRADPRRCLLHLSHGHRRSARSERHAADAGGALSRAARRIDRWRIGRLEDALVRAADIVSLIDPHERALFEAHVGTRAYVTTLPGHDGPRRPARRIDDGTPMRIAVLGSSRSRRARARLRDWLDASAGPMQAAGITLDVIGDIDPPFRETLAKRYPSVVFSGFVDDLDAHLQSARLGVVPDTAGGGGKMRLTSLLFSRVPMAGVVGTIDGLPLMPGRDFVEAADLPALVTCCIDLVRDVDRLDTLQDNAFRACDRRFDWRQRGADLVEAIRQHQRRVDAAYSPLGRTAATLDDLPKLRRSRL